MQPAELAAYLKPKIRTVRGWPKAGVNFRDVTTLFHDPEAFRVMVESFSLDCQALQIDLIAAIIGGALAYQMHRPFVLVRKKGKLPFKTVTEDYALEYGTATLEIHADACKPGDRVFVIDDLIATGGTLLAAARLFRGLHGEVVGVGAIIDLPELGGTRRLIEAGLRVHTLCGFEENE